MTWRDTQIVLNLRPGSSPARRRLRGFGQPVIAASDLDGDNFHSYVVDYKRVGGQPQSRHFERQAAAIRFMTKLRKPTSDWDPIEYVFLSVRHTGPWRALSDDWANYVASWCEQ